MITSVLYLLFSRRKNFIPLEQMSIFRGLLIGLTDSSHSRSMVRAPTLAGEKNCLKYRQSLERPAGFCSDGDCPWSIRLSRVPLTFFVWSFTGCQYFFSVSDIRKWSSAGSPPSFEVVASIMLREISVFNIRFMLWGWICHSWRVTDTPRN